MLPRLAVNVVAMVLAVGETPVVRSSQNDLICYQCQSHSLEECSKAKYLRPCPDDQAYNRCETTIKKTGQNNSLDVTKKCSLAPCRLEVDYLNMERLCEPDRSHFHCTYCCRDNGCNQANFGGSSSHVEAGGLVWWIAFAITTSAFKRVRVKEIG